MTPEKLVLDLADARAAGEAASKSVKDDGSMSADLVHIPVGGSSAIRRRTAEFDRAVSASFYRRVGIWRGYLLTPSGSGLASARLASAQAMARLLSDRGWGASVYYQRD